MLMDDARDQAQAARKRLLDPKNRKALQMPGLRIYDLAEFKERARQETLTREQKEVIVEQAIALLDQIYAHLPFKKARYAVNPVQKLRLLRARVARIEDAEFHSGMLEAFTELRDAHTYYGLPKPYRDKLAFLPFQVASYGAPGERRFVVTRVMEGFESPPFGEGVHLTRWNGVPMETALLRMAAATPGATPDAGFARAMSRLTLRLLEYALPPDEEMVFVEYEPVDGSGQRVIALPWLVAEGWGSMLFRKGQNLSVSALVATEKYGCRLLGTKYEGGHDAPVFGYGPPAEKEIPVKTKFPDTFEAKLLPLQEEGPAAYLRVKDFVLAPEEFTREFARLLREFEKKGTLGLLLDIRGNPGGDIRSAEMVLQYLTPRRIKPALFHYVNSALTQEIADIVARGPITESVQARVEFRDWAGDLANAITSADALTSGRPTTPEEDANDRGQIFQQPVVLLIDASVYSAAEIFAGGFIDHEIGPVLGVAESTGGGGANRWDHEELVGKLGSVPGLPLAPLPGGSTLRKLPKGAAIAVAVRRSSRVGSHAGEAIEDVGLRPDVVHVRTLADVLEKDRDLIERGKQILREQTAYLLSVNRARVSKYRGKEYLDVSLNICRIAKVEAWVDQELIGAVWPGYDGRDLDIVTELVTYMPLMRRMRPKMQRLQFMGYNRAGKPCAAVSMTVDQVPGR